MNFLTEPAPSTPIVSQTDVLVAGGGPAGFAAAVAAAREGASVALIETHGCLGGVWTAGMLSLILDSQNKTGVMDELLHRLRERDRVYRNGKTGQVYDVEAMKLLLEEMCGESGVQIRLHTRVCAALQDEGGRLSHVVTESKSGREAWSAQVFVDATGDGDLAAQAGCGFDVGRPEDGHTQPMSLMALLSGINYQEVAPYVHDFEKPYGVDQKRLVELWRQGELVPSYLSPILLKIHDDLFALMANHEYGVSALNADDVTRATIKARAEVNALIENLRAQGGVWSQLKLVATGAQIGVREARRIRGLYEVSSADLIEGARHDDAVCRVTFPVDVHSPTVKDGKSYSNAGVKAQPYDIPLRALIARDCDGLLLAGRCISGDFWAHASYRVTGNSVALGEAAGNFAAFCARNNVSPHCSHADYSAIGVSEREQKLTGSAAR